MDMTSKEWSRQEWADDLAKDHEYSKLDAAKELLAVVNAHLATRSLEERSIIFRGVGRLFWDDHARQTFDGLRCHD